MASFFEHFATLPNPRVERTRLYKLSDILFITMAAVLSGCDDWNEIELYGENQRRAAEKVPGTARWYSFTQHFQKGVLFA